MVSATTSGSSPNPFSRSAETGKSLASQITRACISASSRVTLPSRRPSRPADAPLEVASAANPNAAIILAEPPSHTLAMTNASGAACRARNCFALWIWVTVIPLLLVSAPGHAGNGLLIQPRPNTVSNPTWEDEDLPHSTYVIECMGTADFSPTGKFEAASIRKHPSAVSRERVFSNAEALDGFRSPSRPYRHPAASPASAPASQLPSPRW